MRKYTSAGFISGASKVEGGNAREGASTKWNPD